MKLASGIARIAEMRSRGIAVGFGTDGAASNNRLDVLTEMRTGALLAKVASGDAAALDAQEALEMATIEPARALGLESQIGSIVPGKSADLAAGGASRRSKRCPASTRCLTSFTRPAARMSRMPWVAGEMRLDERRLTSDRRG
jgi:5-methylthioadenosine/S-adenosylhomocysteine deaminase